MSDWTTGDGRVDVAAVMNRIREKIRGRRDLGLYTDEEVEELTALKLQAFADDAGIDPELLARLMADNHNWNISTDYRIETHRAGFGARAIVKLKQLVRPWVRLYTDHPLSRQAQINLYLHYLGHNLVRELVRLQVEVAALRNQLAALQKEKESGRGVKVAFVVQRYGTEVVGGAELHCRWVAEHVALRHEVEVLTTTATDYLSWQNVLPEGETTVNGVRVRRFPVARGRDIRTFDPVANKVCFFEHTDDEERRWLEEHGPVTPALVEHLRRHEAEYDAIVFFSYRYWTTYFGMQIAPRKSILVPTAEHDRVLYLRLFQPFFKQPAAIAFNTPEERELIERVTGNPSLPGEVVGTGIVQPSEVPVAEVAPRLDLLGDYFVYVGRIEPEKGCAVMIDHFLRWQRETRATATLALFGRSTMTFSENAHVRLMGVVPDGEKLAAVARARALVMPSRHESLSMVVLESWMMQRPVLVNGDCEVLRGQVLRADGGLYYRRYEEFAAAMDLLLHEPALADRLGRQGQAYFEANYAWPRILEKYERLLARAAAGNRPS